ncbi:PqqD family protein [Pseudomonadota bacterium]
MSIAEDTVVSLNKQTRFRAMGTEGLVILQENDEVMVVNEVGAAILDNLSEGTSVNNIVDNVFNQYETDKDVLYSDVIHYLHKLAEIGVVELD